ncbi:MAG: thiamine phosphate synthase, partial [Candidatus Omnitrophota bacterium]|nr:thiamine phosphate synthase [Candidatus Omnitrophota bacterium]
MPSKKTSRKDFDLSEARLYLVLDRQVCGYDRLFEILEESAAFGVDVVQLRDKHGEARETLAFARAAVRSLKKRVPFIVNDRADIALLSGAAGVHVGQDDLSCREARSLLGPSAVIGVSCQTLAHAAKAQKDGADY